MGVLDASKIPPVNAQELLESLKARLETFGRGRFQLVWINLSFVIRPLSCVKLIPNDH